MHFSERIEEFASFQLSVNARELGPKLGSKMKDVITAAKAGQWKRVDGGQVEVAGHLLAPGEFTMRLSAKEGTASEALGTNDAVVVLDIKLTPDLEEEGLARDLVRLVQQARKEAGFHVADHIELAVKLSSSLETLIRKHERYISEQTLAELVRYEASGRCEHTQSASLAGETIEIRLARTAAP